MPANRFNEGITPRQEKAIVALINEPTILKAADAIGVAEKTVHRWLDEPAFAAAYARARRKAFAQAIGITQKYASVAAQVLVKIAADETAPHTARVSAAQAVLKFSREAIELDDLARRIEGLEALLKQDKGGDSVGGQPGVGLAA